MKIPLYRQAIIHSWKLAWEHKILWVFGMFAVFLGQMGILDLLTKVGFATTMGRPLHVVWLEWANFIKDLILGVRDLPLALDAWFWMLSLALILLGFGLFLIFVSVVCQGALVKAAAVSTKHKKLPNAGEEWHVGVNHFWRLFFVNLFKKVIFCFLAMSVSWLAVKTILDFSVVSILVFLLGFVLATLIGMVISFLSIYAAGYVVVEEFGLKKALTSSWQLFINHWLVSIEVGLIVVVLNLLAGILAIFLVLIVFIPTLITWALAATSYNMGLWVAGLMVGTMLSTFIVIVVGGFFTVFNISVWTCLFMAMHKVGIKSRILSWFGHASK
ncbi:hypothetical protein KJ785_04785 [Patescibacteria group bacterium]|nr:hypothetical protein [Patescibacteria group bacterium]